MSLNNITSSELRKLIPIVERKESVQEELAEIESELSAYLSQRRGVLAGRASQEQFVSVSLSK